MKKKLTIADFQAVIPWEQIEFALGKRRYKQFLKWMDGQTCIAGGVYPWDLERYLRGLPVID